MIPRYARALSPESLELVKPGQPLHFLAKDFETCIAGDPFALDLHLREKNQLMFYHGGTCVLIATLEGGSAATVRFSAHKKYCSISPDLMRRWTLAEAISMRSAISAHLVAAVAQTNSHFYRNRKEGYGQNRLCHYFGRTWSPEKRLLVVDRECVVGFGSSVEKNQYYKSIKDRYRIFRDRLRSSDPEKWGVPPTRTSDFGDELDTLAIGKGGVLFPIELKHGQNGCGIYWGPLQTSVYHAAFSGAIEIISDEIVTLILQKIALGLLPAESAALLPASGTAFQMGIPILAVISPNERSTCWDKLREVVRSVRAECPTFSMTLMKIPLDGHWDITEESL